MSYNGNSNHLLSLLWGRWCPLFQRVSSSWTFSVSKICKRFFFIFFLIRKLSASCYPLLLNLTVVGCKYNRSWKHHGLVASFHLTSSSTHSNCQFAAITTFWCHHRDRLHLWLSLRRPGVSLCERGYWHCHNLSVGVRTRPTLLPFHDVLKIY